MWVIPRKSSHHLEKNQLYQVSYIKSPSKPDSVRHFLKRHGFDETDIRSLICRHPTILCADANRTMDPNLQAIHRMIDFSESELRRLIVVNHPLFTNSCVIPRLQYWKTFLNCDKKTLLSAFTGNRCLIELDTDKALPPQVCSFKGL